MEVRDRKLGQVRLRRREVKPVQHHDGSIVQLCLIDTLRVFDSPVDTRFELSDGRLVIGDGDMLTARSPVYKPDKGVAAALNLVCEATGMVNALSALLGHLEHQGKR